MGGQRKNRAHPQYFNSVDGAAKRPGSVNNERIMGPGYLKVSQEANFAYENAYEDIVNLLRNGYEIPQSLFEVHAQHMQQMKATGFHMTPSQSHKELGRKK
jgi:hypothetical protein